MGHDVSWANMVAPAVPPTRARGPVVEGQPAMSKLISRLTANSAAQRIPPGQPAPSEVIDKVRAWIAAGANND
jgi:hypothetical protein